MAQMLEVTCLHCDAFDVQLDGPILSGYRPRCEQCGDSRLVPWKGQAGDAAPRDMCTQAQAQWLSDEAGACSCGGRFSPTAPLRCSVCHSTNVTTTSIGVAD